MVKIGSILLLLILTSCGRYYTEVYQQRVDATYLASTSIGSPDPHQAHPPLGQLLVVEWQVPVKLLPENPFIQLNVIFWDDTERHYVWPINQRRGFERLFIIDDDFESTGGVLTYRAQIKTEDGAVFREWRHQLWVNLITVENQMSPLKPKPAPQDQPIPVDEEEV